jgi:transposase
MTKQKRSSQAAAGRAAGAAEGARRATGAAPADATSTPRRWTARRKLDVVLRLLRGESLDALARETKQPASRIADWRDQVLAGGEELLKSRAGDPAYEAWLKEKRDLQAKVGEITMENELLYEKIHRMEAGHPLAPRRSKR